MNRKLRMEELNRLDAAEFLTKKKLDFVIVLDNVRSHHNVGAIFRTADAFNVAEIILLGITPTPPHREIHKTALGATETVLWRHFTEQQVALKYLEDNQYQLICLEQTVNSIPLDTLPSLSKCALIVGNEVDGVEDFWIQKSAYCTEIPQEGTKHSLNVSVATGIAMWHFYNKLKR
jgi:23S rRNA (guanosine2251-2'-O)-methyltransferase